MGVALVKAEPKKMGRPSTVTDEVVAKLEFYAVQGLTVRESAAVAGISCDAAYRFLRANSDFRRRIERLQTMTTIAAKLRIVEAIKAGDVKAAQWWLERKLPEEFSIKGRGAVSKRTKAVNDLSPEEIQRRLEKLLEKTVPNSTSIKGSVI